jgi:hypothetical protein
VFASNSQSKRASASDSPPISRAAISAARRWPRWMARWNRPCAVPWLVIMSMPPGQRLSESLRRAAAYAQSIRKELVAGSPVAGSTTRLRGEGRL